jgi:hypothetical protein
VSEPSISFHQASTADLLTTLFSLGREVTSVLDLTEALHKIPELIARLTGFQAFAVYLAGFPLDHFQDHLMTRLPSPFHREICSSSSPMACPTHGTHWGGTSGPCGSCG